jgi:flagellar biosynthesis/type III secretory pathway chaperone
MPIDTKVCYEQMATLLAAEADALARLEELLRQEHEVLGQNDVTALERTSSARQEQISALANIEEQRRALCRTQGFTTDAKGLRELIATCDSMGNLSVQLNRCTERATRCRQLNERNGAVVAARLKRVEGLLGILTGRGDEVPTYGPQGSPQGAGSGSRSGRVLGAA